MHNQIQIQWMGVGLHTVRGGIDLGGSLFRPRIVQDENVWKNL